MDLDALISVYEDRKQRTSQAPGERQDPVDRLRVQMMSELIPTFNAIASKYAPAGFALKFDVMGFLAGQRDLRIDITFGGSRVELQGTITSEMIAFNEVHYEGDVAGQICSGASLRLRTLTADLFREFLCDRLAVMVRAALRRTGGVAAEQRRPLPAPVRRRR